MVTETQPTSRKPEVKLLDQLIFDVRHTSGRLLTAIAHNEFEIEALSGLIKRHSSTGSNVQTHLIGSTAFLYSGDGLKLYSIEEPFRTGSPESESLYVAVGMFENCIFLAQYKRPNLRSSWHSHTPGEHFFNPDQNAFRYRDDGHVSKVGSYTYVPANEPHMIYTLDQPSFTLILHEGTELNHDQILDRPRPTIDQLRGMTIRAGLYPAV